MEHVIQENRFSTWYDNGKLTLHDDLYFKVEAIKHGVSKLNLKKGEPIDDFTYQMLEKIYILAEQTLSIRDNRAEIENFETLI